MQMDGEARTSSGSGMTSYCTNCGTVIPEGGRFCPSCGRDSAEAASTTVPVPAVPVVPPAIDDIQIIPDPELTKEVPLPEAAPGREIDLTGEVATEEAGTDLEGDKIRKSRKRLVASGIAGLVLVGSVGAALLLRGPGSDGGVSALVARLTDASPDSQQVERARSIAELAAGLESLSADMAMDGDPRADALAVADDDARPHLVEVVESHVRFAAAAKSLAGITPPHLERWLEETDAFVNAAADLDEAWEDAEIALALEVTGPRYTDAAEATRALVQRATARLAEWQAEVGNKLSALETYKAQVSDAIADYRGMRADLQGFADHIDDQGSSYQAAFSMLASAAERRQNIRDRLAAITAPVPSLREHHDRLAQLVGDARRAVDSAHTGINEYSVDPWYYDFDYESTPGWQTFERESSRISQALDEAMAVWEFAVDEQLAGLRAQPHPAV